MCLKKNALEYLIKWTRRHLDDKPVIYFSNGMLKHETIKGYKVFEEFIEDLSYWSSWSGGLCIWKEDFYKIPSNIEYNILFPHTDILFYNLNKKSYIIDNTCLFFSIEEDALLKGKYNLFYAFSVEYLEILLKLVKDDMLSIKSFLKIKKDLKYFLVDLYIDYVFLHKPCSYDLKQYQFYLNVYYSYNEFYLGVLKRFFVRAVKKFYKLLKL